MKKLYFLSLLILVFSGYSQNFPYLNASTGNENEFPVDQDTNIYMFHGNRLVKTDKNISIIWAKNYSGINFSNLLLSKTGSMYFIGNNYSVFGKLNANGTVDWIKSTQGISAVLSGSTSVSFTFQCGSLLLDRNNHLVVTGSESGLPGFQEKGFLIKTDTNGNVLKFKCFETGSGPNRLAKLRLINDSMGYYKIVGSGYYGMGPGEELAIHSYSDQSDIFLSTKPFHGIGYGSWKLMRSKLSNCFYIYSTTQIPPAYYSTVGIDRFDLQANAKSGAGISNLNNLLSVVPQYAEESANGDIYFSVSTTPMSQNYTNAIIKLDSNGVCSSAVAVFNAYFVPSWTVAPSAKGARFITSNSYYFEVTGGYFPGNPLTVQKINSSLTWSCASTVTSNVSCGLSNYTPVQIVGSPTLSPVTSYTLPSSGSSVNSVTFSVNTNFCLLMNSDDIGSEKDAIIIYPNPTNEKITIDNIEWDEVKIRDLNGKEIRTFGRKEDVFVGDFVNGIYFIRIKTAEGEVNKKFIKN